MSIFKVMSDVHTHAV